jgi:hypothetical protein
MRGNRKIEGYWHSKPYVMERTSKSGFTLRKEIPSKDTYPTPVANEITQEEALEIYELITDKEKDVDVISYRGSTVSRFTDERLGSKEYWTNDWLWPEDFAKHYVLEHRVKPSKEFLEFIGYKN